MKKFFDKYVFSRFGVQLSVSVCILLLFALLAPSCRRMAVGPGGAAGFFASLGWGLKQVATPAGAVGTIETLDGVSGAVPAAAMFLMSLLCWLVCICVLSFVTGAIVNAFRNRKQLIDAGKVFYSFRDHGLVVGWDFQGPACVRRLLSEEGGCGEVLVVSAVDAAEIRRDLRARLGGEDLSRVYVYNGSVTTSAGLLARSYPELARTVVILGERGGADNDGANLLVAELVRAHVAARSDARAGRPPVKVFLHIARPVLHAQALSMSKGGLPENDGALVLEAFSHAESWAWKCWSEPGSDDGAPDRPGEPYLPLRRHGARRVELFVVGDAPAGRAMARFALPLLNYGGEGRNNRVTVFGKPSAAFPEQRVLDNLPECEVVFLDVDGLSREADERMVAAASDPETAVTIVLAAPSADAAAEAYAGLSGTLRRMDVSVLAWMPTTSRRCPAKAFLQANGDRAKLRYFGMTDVLPWMEPARQKAGAAVNYFYDLVFNRDDKTGEKKYPSLPDPEALPPSNDPDFAKVVKSLWNEKLALERWHAIERWARWSSVNAADAFKERAAAFPDFASDLAVRDRLLRAEHNRWWTERLLAGWKPCPKPADDAGKDAEKAAFRHWDMVPFDRLGDFTKELDRVPLAAMIALESGAKE